MDLHIVLFEPEIPPNTGNIARTCAAIGARLHLIEPLGFSIKDRDLKRAGLDYWDQLQLSVHPSFEAFAAKEKGQYVAATKRAPRGYTELRYESPCYIILGRETSGLPDSILALCEPNLVRIPMRAGTRCLNLSNAAAVLAYEVLRQNSFEGLQIDGSENQE